MNHSDIQQLASALQAQTALLQRIAAAADRTNALLFSMLTPEQRQEDQKKQAELAAARLQSPKLR